MNIIPAIRLYGLKTRNKEVQKPGDQPFNLRIEILIKLPNSLLLA